MVDLNLNLRLEQLGGSLHALLARAIRIESELEKMIPPHRTATPTEVQMRQFFADAVYSLKDEWVSVGRARAGTQAKDNGGKQNLAGELDLSSGWSAQCISFS